MDHSQATTLKATEQYLLGELSEPLRAEFEEHFMSCAECARDVRAGAIFVENAREVLRAEVPALVPTKVDAKSEGGWFAGLFRPVIAAPAFAVLLAIIAYQAAVTIPHLKSAQSRVSAPVTLASFSLIDANSRGGGPAMFTVQPGQPFSLDIDVPPQPQFPMYNLEIDGENGAPQFTVPVSAQEARKTVQLLVPPSTLAGGQYTLVIQGVTGSNDSRGTEVSRSSFALEYGQRPNAPVQ
jgi:hypothetical protein